MTSSALLDALRALRDGHRDEALRSVRQAPPSLLADSLAGYLDTGERVGVYDQPAAFQAFITGGGNVGLYEATARALASAHAEVGSPSVLDIGCGDGAALVPALAQGRGVSALDLVELSAALLDTALHRLRAAGVTATAHHGTAQDFSAALRQDQRWDVVESTFALHTIPEAERGDVLTRLRPHTDRIVVVEFDVPDYAPDGDDRLVFLADTYERGLAEYSEDRDLVANGFLMPVLVGQLTPGAARVTYEQPAEAWAAQLRDRGYRDVRYERLFPYWSSPAFVLTGRG